MVSQLSWLERTANNRKVRGSSPRGTSLYNDSKHAGILFGVGEGMQRNPAIANPQRPILFCRLEDRQAR